MPKNSRSFLFFLIKNNNFSKIVNIKNSQIESQLFIFFQKIIWNSKTNPLIISRFECSQQVFRLFHIDRISDQSGDYLNEKICQKGRSLGKKVQDSENIQEIINDFWKSGLLGDEPDSCACLQISVAFSDDCEENAPDFVLKIEKR